MRVLISWPIPHPDMPSFMGIPAVKALWTVFKQGKGLVGAKNGIMRNV